MKKTLNLLALLLVVTVFLCLPAANIRAHSGVGIAPGTIRVDNPLLPGSRYDLPSVQVLNTGDESNDYVVQLASMADQEELQPPAGFIDLSPTSFRLEAGANQIVSLSLDIPVRAKPGDYLAYIEARPVAAEDGGGTQIGAAVATKLYFTVKPANLFVGVMNSIANFFSRTAPASYIILGIIVLGLAIFFLRRRIKVDITIARK
jgi:hypothetical protein